MRVMSRVIVALASFVILPATVFAQASLSGFVKDTSGAVLPGVSIEASSPVLIEKVRTGISDSTGLYRIPDLPPGLYTLTFTLPGFATVSREGVEVAGAGVTTINADMRVGAVDRNDHGDRRIAGGRHPDQHATAGGALERRGASRFRRRAGTATCSRRCQVFRPRAWTSART